MFKKYLALHLEIITLQVGLISTWLIKVYKYSPIPCDAISSENTTALQCDKFNSLLKYELTKLTPDSKELHSTLVTIELEDWDELEPEEPPSLPDGRAI